MSTTRFVVLAGVFLAFTVSDRPCRGSADDEKTIVNAAYTVATARCLTCHGKEKQDGGINFLDRESLLKAKVLTNNEEDWERSPIWLRIVEQDPVARMPQPVGDEPGMELAAIEKEAIRRWLEIGAPPFPEPSMTTRPLVTVKDIYRAVIKDLQTQTPSERRFTRYFSIAHLHNNQNIEDWKLPFYRAALSKVLNSLSWDPEIHTPVPIDPHATILRVNLAEIGWDKPPGNGKSGEATPWEILAFEYPYTVVHDQSDDPELKANTTQVMDDLGTRLPIIRADWFVATAAQPPLYHDILGIPETLDELLQERLQIRLEDEFRKNREARAGFVESGVSAANRMVIRYRTPFGAVWVSLDYKSSAGDKNVLGFPLGSVPLANPELRRQISIPKFASAPDGGEVVFHLPNGLIGYMIVDALGKRIDRAPASVVRDKVEPLGNTEVINGISCLACHTRGVKRFTDNVRQQHLIVEPNARAKVQSLFPPQDELDRLLDRDERRFSQANVELSEPFLSGEDLVTEPIGSIAIAYSNKLDLESAIAEIITEDGRSPDESEVAVRYFVLKKLEMDPALAKLGARTLLSKDGRLQRDTWESQPTGKGFSHFQLFVHGRSLQDR